MKISAFKTEEIVGAGREKKKKTHVVRERRNYMYSLHDIYYILFFSAKNIFSSRDARVFKKINFILF